MMFQSETDLEIAGAPANPAANYFGVFNPGLDVEEWSDNACKSLLDIAFHWGLDGIDEEISNRAGALEQAAARALLESPVGSGLGGASSMPRPFSGRLSSISTVISSWAHETACSTPLRL